MERKGKRKMIENEGNNFVNKIKERKKERRRSCKIHKLFRIQIQDLFRDIRRGQSVCKHVLTL
jgi:hypothetical protein